MFVLHSTSRSYSARAHAVLDVSFSTAKVTGSLETVNTGVHAVHRLAISFIRPTRNGVQDQGVRVYCLE